MSEETTNETTTPPAPSSEEASADEPSMEALIEERDKLKDQLLRTAADFDNFRKRIKRDLDDVRWRAKEDALRDVLPIIDNLERAVAAAETATDIKAVSDGVKMVLRGFEEISDRMGLKRVEAVGAQFDPNLHDAVQQVETAEHPAGTVVAEVVPGYTLKEKLLRPAMVVVARPPAQPTEPAAKDSEDGGEGS